ncbi:alpha/beta hydrolase family esterase [Agaribacter marinus]|uniref:Hydrolase n=1 Tax=Agaribacter marinus TaxID=1431249 RepID=A0AA37SWM5_9ALTE|nr:PHB depolymerase family esterase [Agaribacter marinus]GLR70079.1 hydrolase [Agaribacter marinus]
MRYISSITLTIAAFLTILLLTSCTSNTQTSDHVFKPTNIKGSHTFDGNSGKIIEHNFNHNGIKRSYIVYLPTNHQPDNKSALVLSLHGRTGTSHALMKSQRWHSLADSENFVVVFPQSAATELDGKLMTQWNALNVNSGIDDVSFLKNVVSRVHEQYKTSAKKAYVAGFSNGGMMVSRLVCEADGTFAAMASVAGIGSTAHSDCVPRHVTPIAFIHGEKDLLPPQKGQLSNLRPVQETISMFVETYNCSDMPVVKLLEDKAPNDGTRTTMYRYQGCNEDAVVEYYFVKNGGHTWPGNKPVTWLGNTSQDFTANEILWQFFSRHELKFK